MPRPLCRCPPCDMLPNHGRLSQSIYENNGTGTRPVPLLMAKSHFPTLQNGTECSGVGLAVPVIYFGMGLPRVPVLGPVPVPVLAHISVNFCSRSHQECNKIFCLSSKTVYKNGYYYRKLAHAKGQIWFPNPPSDVIGASASVPVRPLLQVRHRRHP
ncbi:hypothetical protein GGX14DRAFT_394447 [Mycena pura]|uniref:Uncharacterized protein n=1 Tax=Mycena pura TaxID=153505 RepID=A0AAD6VFX6_9AGAR|nr:hypothetical protein GGX14DRAFT_394447 [Mycena pura]